MTEVISIHKALILEARSDIEIYATNRVSSPLNKLPNFNKWKSNWDELASRYHKIPIHKLASFVNFDYIIEYKFNNESALGNLYFTTAPADRVIEKLVAREDLSSEDARIIHKIRKIRNEVVHTNDVDVTIEQALQFAEILSAISLQLRHKFNIP
jgi:hypothetical protein